MNNKVSGLDLDSFNLEPSSRDDMNFKMVHTVSPKKKKTVRLKTEETPGKNIENSSSSNSSIGILTSDRKNSEELKEVKELSDESVSNSLKDSKTQL